MGEPYITSIHQKLFERLFEIHHENFSLSEFGRIRHKSTQFVTNVGHFTNRRISHNVSNDNRCDRSVCYARRFCIYGIKPSAATFPMFFVCKLNGCIADRMDPALVRRFKIRNDHLL